MNEEQAKFDCGYPLFVIEQDGRVALIQGPSPDGAEVTHLCVFPADDLADRFALGHRIGARGVGSMMPQRSAGCCEASMSTVWHSMPRGTAISSLSGPTVRKDPLLRSIAGP